MTRELGTFAGATGGLMLAAALLGVVLAAGLAVPHPLVNLLFAASFLVRAIAFFYRPIGGCFMPFWLFWFLAYCLPELTPTSFHFIYGSVNFSQIDDFAAQG